MSEAVKDQKPSREPDQEWLTLYNEALAARGGTKSSFATELGVSPSTVTRIGQGVPHSPGLLHRASILLGIRDPTTIPLDPLQQRLLRTLDEWRRTMPIERAEEIVTYLEDRTELLRESIAKMMTASGRTRGSSADEGLAQARLDVREALEGLGVRPTASAEQSLIRTILQRKIDQATKGLGLEAAEDGEKSE